MSETERARMHNLKDQLYKDKNAFLHAIIGEAIDDFFRIARQTWAIKTVWEAYQHLIKLKKTRPRSQQQ